MLASRRKREGSQSRRHRVRRADRALETARSAAAEETREEAEARRSAAHLGGRGWDCGRGRGNEEEDWVRPWMVRGKNLRALSYTFVKTSHDEMIP